MVKNCDLGLENAQYKTSVTVFHHTDLPAGKYHIFLIAAVCSFPRKIKIVIYMVQAVPRSTNGAWWYKHCHKSNLNGLYFNGQHASRSNGVNWFTFRGFYYSLKRTEMKVKAKG